LVDLLYDVHWSFKIVCPGTFSLKDSWLYKFIYISCLVSVYFTYIDLNSFFINWTYYFVKKFKHFTVFFLLLVRS
jgi:hypothetical protein